MKDIYESIRYALIGANITTAFLLAMLANPWAFLNLACAVFVYIAPNPFGGSQDAS